MAFFDDAKKKMADVGKGVSKQAKQMSDTVRLNGEISKEEKCIRQAFADLGQAYYESHKSDDSAENREIINSINGAYEKINQLKKEIANLKGVIVCPSCGGESPKDSAFCTRCGAKLPEEREEEKTEKDEPEKEGTEKEGEHLVCPACGAAAVAGSSFCEKCGQKLTDD